MVGCCANSLKVADLSSHFARSFYAVPLIFAVAVDEAANKISCLRSG